ncbi:MAG: methylmalonyl Co-A mutase-associated GTPase MeaB [Flavipsychrobacter sp.]|nr:methylmalonyl Co-A mutase-associated GTPase MeaB [Flavipsychrobacter sp.]
MKDLLERIKEGQFGALARGITLVENSLPGYKDLLKNLSGTGSARVLGITGPPGAGKSTLVNALLHHWVKQGKKIAVIAVDPSSPFNYGALLGDRIRMADFYNNEQVYIRSLATRGALGGLNPKIIEITDVAKHAPFDIVLVETVGVGQTEVEIAGIADCTVVTLVPEAGDAIQTMKAGILEIADVFAVNKSDRADAEKLYQNLKILVHEKAGMGEEIPVLKTVATERTGIEELAHAVERQLAAGSTQPEKRLHLLAEKSWQLIVTDLLKGIDTRALKAALAEELKKEDFNLYAFAEEFSQTISLK